MPALAPSRVTQDYRRPFKGAVLRGAIAIGFAIISDNVAAQVSGSVALVSDYRYRGYSLSAGDPAAQLTVAYDDARGWYAGAFASTVRVASQAQREVQAIPFVGYAWRVPSGVSFDIGAHYSTLTGSRSYGYPEIHSGIAFENVSATVYYAPRYFGGDAGAVYAELNGSQPLHDRIRLLAHIGILLGNGSNSNGGNPYGSSPYNIAPDRRIVDAQVGIGIDLDPFHVQVSWVGVDSSRNPYPISRSGPRNGVVLSLSRSF